MMTAMADSAVAWQQESTAVGLICGPLQGRVEIDALGTRFAIQSWLGRPAKSHAVLSTSGPISESSTVEFSDRYVRGRDLVLTLAKHAPFQFDPRIYWRATPRIEFGAAQIELVLSVQTDLLDSEPEWTVSSLQLDGELFHASRLSVDGFEQFKFGHQEIEFDRRQSSEHLFVLRNSRFGVSYAEMVHPSDFVRARIVADSSILESTLFPEHLEKGVIRRGRICSWFMPAENDLQTAVDLARQFVDEPLPLTT
jgi:hypothetical protein